MSIRIFVLNKVSAIKKLKYHTLMYNGQRGVTIAMNVVIKKRHILCDLFRHVNSVLNAAIKQQKNNAQTYQFTNFVYKDDGCYFTQLKRQKSYKGDSTWHPIAIFQCDVEYYHLFKILPF